MLDYLNIIGLIINFIGAVFLSAGLIQAETEIRDLEASYWDENPYKIRSGLLSQPYYKWGFRLLIVGFSINIAVGSNNLLPTSKNLEIIFLAVAISGIGWLLIQGFENRKAGQHLEYKRQLHTDQFFKTLRHISRESRDYSTRESYKSEDAFRDYKTKRTSELRKRIGEINSEYQEDAKELTTDLSTALDFEKFITLIEEYLKSYDKKS